MDEAVQRHHSRLVKFVALGSHPLTVWDQHREHRKLSEQKWSCWTEWSAREGKFSFPPNAFWDPLNPSQPSLFPGSLLIQVSCYSVGSVLQFLQNCTFVFLKAWTIPTPLKKKPKTNPTNNSILLVLLRNPELKSVKIPLLRYEEQKNRLPLDQPWPFLVFPLYGLSREISNPLKQGL